MCVPLWPKLFYSAVFYVYNKCLHFCSVFNWASNAIWFSNLRNLTGTLSTWQTSPWIYFCIASINSSCVSFSHSHDLVMMYFKDSPISFSFALNAKFYVITNLHVNRERVVNSFSFLLSFFFLFFIFYSSWSGESLQCALNTWGLLFLFDYSDLRSSVILS